MRPTRLATVASVTSVPFAPEDGVGDVAAVELADGKEVQRCGQQAKPGGKCHRVQVHRVAFGRRAPDQPGDCFEEQRLTEFEEAGGVGRQRRHAGETQADQQHGNGDDEPGDRPGNTDVEQLALACDRSSDANKCAERASQGQRRRQKVGERRIDPVDSTGEIVAELVRPKNGKDGPAVPKAVQEKKRARGVQITAPEIDGEARKVFSPSEDGRCDGQKKQDEVPPDRASATSRYRRDVDRVLLRRRRWKILDAGRRDAHTGAFTRYSEGLCRV